MQRGGNECKNKQTISTSVVVGDVLSILVNGQQQLRRVTIDVRLYINHHHLFPQEWSDSHRILSSFSENWWPRWIWSVIFIIKTIPKNTVHQSKPDCSFFSIIVLRLFHYVFETWGHVEGIDHPRIRIKVLCFGTQIKQDIDVDFTIKYAQWKGRVWNVIIYGGVNMERSLWVAIVAALVITGRSNHVHPGIWTRSYM